MDQQLDLFREPPPVQTSLITPDGLLVLTHPVMRPTGAEEAERKSARLREIDDRKREKKGMVYA